ncbi:MAG: transcriptional repressor LexA [Wenzhouxiangellaceae bacterium]|nr:transcriptional repressor LexA [Wenzhouxiangellaceae bacterium]
MMELSTRQREILDFIHLCLQRNGLPPTRAEINRHFGWSSPNAAQSHLRALARKGAISLNPRLARGIQATAQPIAQPDDPGDEHGIPLIGRVAAGRPLLAIEHQERRVAVDPALFEPAPDYLLRVRGESMRDAGIHDGDLLAVHRTPEARHGEIVVARINDEVTVKRLRRRGRGVWLDPANPDFQPLAVSAGDEFAIEGRAVGVLRAL